MFRLSRCLPKAVIIWPYVTDVQLESALGIKIMFFLRQNSTITFLRPGLQLSWCILIFWIQGNFHPYISWYDKHSIVHAPTKLVICVILVLPSYICDYNFYPLCVLYYDKDSFAQPFILPCCWSVFSSQYGISFRITEVFMGEIKMTLTISGIMKIIHTMPHKSVNVCVLRLCAVSLEWSLSQFQNTLYFYTLSQQ